MHIPIKLVESLKQAGYSVTKPRRVVFQALSDADAVSMAQLIKIVGNNTDRTSIYRTVDLFEKLGIVQRIHIGWKYKIELSEQFSHHHHHATCLKCGRTESFEEGEHIESAIHTLAGTLGYDLQNHTLELRGLCNNCKKNSEVQNNQKS